MLPHHLIFNVLNSKSFVLCTNGVRGIPASLQQEKYLF